MPDLPASPPSGRTGSPDSSAGGAWRRVQLARHPQRPYTLDYIRALCADFVELHGDRRFGDDPAIVGGLARFAERTVVVIGHQKGRDTRENLERHFGMPRPEGYRKALRLFAQAEKFGFPLITLLDTPGADPGLQSEERGQAEAIAENLLTLMRLGAPSISVVIGEGGSGGALALGVTDRVLMLENAIYSVASPEAAAAIVWRDSGRAPQAAEAMRISAPDLLELGLIDRIVPEPPGGAHLDHAAAAALLGAALAEELARLTAAYARPGGWDRDRLLADRRGRFRRIGPFRAPTRCGGLPR